MGVAGLGGIVPGGGWMRADGAKLSLRGTWTI
jgi:hypothetical protein